MLSQRRATWGIARDYGPILVFGVLLLLAPSVLSEFRLNLLAKFLTFAIVALALDLLWGYTGALSLGHGVFFGLGGYAMAMFLKLEAADGDLPDFMNWSGLTKLPWFWSPFEHAYIAFPLAVIGPGLLAFAIGYLVFRSRVTGVYFSIITQALCLILSIFFVGQQAYTGGTNGLTNFTTIFGRYVIAPETQKALYFITVGALVVLYILVRLLTRTRFGRLLIAVRDDENRVRFSGYNVVLIKSAVFAISAAIAGLAGALFVPQVGIISPANLGIVPSIEMVVWVAIGGRGTLFGAVLGALIVGWAKSSLSEEYPDIWQIFLGLLFIGSVILFPGGVLRFAGEMIERLRRAVRPMRLPAAPALRSDSDAAVMSHGD